MKINKRSVERFMWGVVISMFLIGVCNFNTSVDTIKRDAQLAQMKVTTQAVITVASNVTTSPAVMSRGVVNRDSEDIRRINMFLSGALKGQGENIVHYSRQYDVNPRLITAIILHETGHGTSYAVKYYKNVGGLMGDHGLRKFSTLAQSIEFMCGNLKTLYIDRGLTSIELIQPVYCPVGADNDPTHLNESWLPTVTKLYNQITNIK